MASLQSKFQNLNPKVNQMWTTDIRTDKWTSSIHKPEMLCYLAKKYPLPTFCLLMHLTADLQ